MQKIVEIIKLSNGSHRNQTGTSKTIPEGWAVIPDDMTLENFPFGEVHTHDVGGITTVERWIPGEVPESTYEAEPTTEELLNIILGVDE